jgi:hypothetical protein
LREESAQQSRVIAKEFFNVVPPSTGKSGLALEICVVEL